ncbi:MAG: hypothetical protein LKI25_08500 [Atopobiaceae bacterium]|jgi:Flp pilus assembly protein TadG|nr:hypothetical protein [Atopobiaceae bacterium]MCI2174227.1 hypothetical protein [Atopobiaceae bacterium]MCI2206868.1 hypothetical protein [Atopobiaceae bacterium]
MRGSRAEGEGAARGQSGQSTVEYALVLLAFMAMLAAMAFVWHAAEGGGLGRLAADAASHSLANGITLELVQDVALF